VTDGDSPEIRLRRDRLEIGLAALVCVVLGVWWAAGVNRDLAWGWDESMHTELPAVRMLLFARDGEWRLAFHALHDCVRYPFAWPASLAAVQSFTGISEIAARMAGRAVWAVGVFGIFLLARELVARIAEERGVAGRGDRLAPWLALVFATTSPLALAFSGTLFLEVPFVVVSIFALRAWLRRGRGHVARRELAAGAWLALAFFTKFNYGLLLGFGLALALVVEIAQAVRAGLMRPFLPRVAWLAAVPVIAFAWWFVVPLPEGLDMGRAHREGLVAFLSGNLDESMKTAAFLRPVHAATFLVWAPRVLVFLLVGALFTLREWRARAVWTLWIAWLASTAPVLLHPFHLDRFLLPGAVFLWVLAGLGIARMLPAKPLARVVAIPTLVLALALFPNVDAFWVLRLAGIANPAQHAYQEEMLKAFRDLRPGRRLDTNGFARAEVESLLDMLQPEVRGDDHVGWVGMTQNFSPGALHAGLLARGAGAPDEVKRGAIDQSFIELGYVDPQWTREQILAWADGYSLLITSDPIDLAGNPDRQFLARYRDEILASGRWQRRDLGRVTIRRPRGVIESQLYALRRAE